MSWMTYDENKRYTGDIGDLRPQDSIETAKHDGGAGVVVAPDGTRIYWEGAEYKCHDLSDDEIRQYDGAAREAGYCNAKDALNSLNLWGVTIAEFEQFLAQNGGEL